MKKGNIIQIINPNHNWFGCLLIVDEVKSFGCQAYLFMPTNDDKPNGAAYTRLNHKDFKDLGIQAPIEAE